jgi:hypothetical protein
MRLTLRIVTVLSLVFFLALPVLTFATTPCIGSGCPGGDTGGNPPCIGSGCPGGDTGGGSGTSGGSGGGTSVSFDLPNPLSCDGKDATAPCVLDIIIRALLAIAAPIAVLMILVGAFQILTAGGSAEKVENGRKTITYAVVGFVIVLFASSFVYIIKSFFGVQS